ncbi:lipopolysaccharide biosynthesis protein [Candidatus Hydrogenedentota bacterium]
MTERVEISKKLVLINSASSLAMRFLSLSVLIWLQQYLLKRITPEEYSLLPVLYSVMLFSPLLTTILTGGLGRFITIAYAKDDDEEITRICSTMFPILCVAGLLFLIGGWFFAWHIDKVLNIAPDRVWDARIMMAILMFSAAVRLPLALFAVGFFVRQKFVLQNIIGIGCTLFRLSLLFTLLFAVSTRVLWVVTAATAAELLNFAITCSISMRLVPALRFRLSRFRWAIAKEITSFGGWQFSMALGNTIRSALDPIVLNSFATPWDIACFHLAALPFQHLWQFIGMAKSTVNPALTAMHAASEKARLRAAFLQGNRISLWAFLLPAVPLALFSSQIIELYVGPNMWLTAVLLQINFFSLLMLIPSAMFASIAEATGKLRGFCLLVLATHLVNLALTFFLVGGLGLGAMGSCISTAVASAIFYPLFIWPLSRKVLELGMKHWQREVLWPGILPTLGAIPVYAIGVFVIDAKTVFGLTCTIAIGGIVSVICLYTFAAREQDLEDFARVSAEVRKRLGGLLSQESH